MLFLELSKESYERSGLQGLPARSAGRKHVKSRYGMSVFLCIQPIVHPKQPAIAAGDRFIHTVLITSSR